MCCLKNACNIKQAYQLWGCSMMLDCQALLRSWLSGFTGEWQQLLNKGLIAAVAGMPATQGHRPPGQVRTNFNFNLDNKRVLNFDNVVTDDDNVKQVKGLVCLSWGPAAGTCC